MRGERTSSGSKTAVSRLAIIAGGVLLFFLLSNRALTILTVWVMVSLPIGILIGHCVLSER